MNDSCALIFSRVRSLLHLVKTTLINYIKSEVQKDKIQHNTEKTFCASWYIILYKMYTQDFVNSYKIYCILVVFFLKSIEC
jgi:hypothetical protein